MFGHKWEPAQGVIKEARTDQVATSAHHGLQERHVYVIDVRTAEGRAFQASLPAPAALRRPLPPGTAVHLEVNPKTGEVRFDPGHPLDGAASGQITSLREAVHLAKEMRGATGGGGLSATLAHLGEAAAAAAAAGAAGQFEHGAAPGARVIGGAEAAELVQGLLGGGDRAAALARIRQIRAEAMGQAGGQVGPDGAPVVVVSQTTHLTGVTGPQASGPQVSGPAEPETFHSHEPSTFAPVDPTPPAGAFGRQRRRASPR